MKNQLMEFLTTHNDKNVFKKSECYKNESFCLGNKVYEDIIEFAAHQNHIYNFEESEYYRCYYCGKKLKSQTLFDELENDSGIPVVDTNGICFCQYCGIDSIIPESNIYDIDDAKFISDMKKFYFG